MRDGLVETVGEGEGRAQRQRQPPGRNRRSRLPLRARSRSSLRCCATSRRELVVVACGVDASLFDPLSRLGVTAAGFAGDRRTAARRSQTRSAAAGWSRCRRAATATSTRRSAGWPWSRRLPGCRAPRGPLRALHRRSAMLSRVPALAARRRSTSSAASCAAAGRRSSSRAVQRARRARAMSCSIERMCARRSRRPHVRVAGADRSQDRLVLVDRAVLTAWRAERCVADEEQHAAQIDEELDHPAVAAGGRRRCRRTP